MEASRLVLAVFTAITISASIVFWRFSRKSIKDKNDSSSNSQPSSPRPNEVSAVKSTEVAKEEKTSSLSEQPTVSKSTEAKLSTSPAAKPEPKTASTPKVVASSTPAVTSTQKGCVILYSELPLSAKFVFDNFVTNKAHITWKQDRSVQGATLVMDDGDSLKGDLFISKYFARGFAAELLGNTPLDQALVDKWLKSVNHKEKPQQVLESWNKHLGKKTNFVGNDITLADIHIWVALKYHEDVRSAYTKSSNSLGNLKKFVDFLDSKKNFQAFSKANESKPSPVVTTTTNTAKTTVTTTTTTSTTQNTITTTTTSIAATHNVTVSYSETPLLASFIHKFTEKPKHQQLDIVWNKVENLKQPSIHFADTGDVLHGDLVIASYFERVHKFSLRGDNVMDQSLVDAWLKSVSSQKDQEAALAEWNNHLRMRTYFVGSALSLVDIHIWILIKFDKSIQTKFAEKSKDLSHLERFVKHLDTIQSFSQFLKSSNPPSNSSNSSSVGTRLDLLQKRHDTILEEAQELQKLLKNIYLHPPTQGEIAVIKACKDAGLKSFFLRQTPSDYYDWDLERRRAYLKADSIHHLCKMLIIENKECKTALSDPNYSQFYCVIIQYSTTYKSANLKEFLQTLKGNKLSKNQYNLQFTDEQVAIDLTGFQHNGMCPIGMAKKVPVILSDRILELKPGYIWLGGGHKDVKLCVDINEFVAKTSPFAANVTNPGYSDDVKGLDN